jgi:putative CocE/NonD family hydrolase
VRQLLTFFDHFLKGTDDSVLSWPKVRIEVRERAYVQELRAEKEWPLQRQQLTALYLDAGTSRLSREASRSEAQVRYDSADKTQAAHFDYVFPVDTEITGHMKLKLWVAAATHNDADLFAAIQKIDRNGELVGFHYYASFDTGPAALGWLRASHRALDPKLSSPEQPIQHHRREELLTPGEPVAVEIEIWPSSTLFRQGERLRVLVKGSDIYPYPDRAPGLPLALHEDTRNKGEHVILTGARYDSHLLVPVIAT